MVADPLNYEHPDFRADPADGREELTELMVAKRLVTTVGEDLRYLPAEKSFLVWDSTRFRRDDIGMADLLAKNTVLGMRDLVTTGPGRQQMEMHRTWLNLQTAGRVSGILKLASTEPGVPVRPEELDADPNVLNCRNGTVDLRTGELRPHNRGDLITRLVNVDYVPGAQSDLWDDFLRRIFKANPELIGYTQRLLGYATTGHNSEQILPIAHGDGNNGKSQLLNAVRILLGDYAMQMDVEVIAHQRWRQHTTELTDLRGIRLAVTTELNEAQRLNEARVKLITGGEAIRARGMYQNNKEFESTATVVVVSNKLPRINGTDEGIWRRIRRWPFQEEIEAKERIVDYYKVLLATSSEAILAWLIEGAQGWYETGLETPDIVLEATDEFREQEDSFAGFINSSCTHKEDSRTLAKLLRERYETWCHDAGLDPVSKIVFGKRLATLGYAKDKSNRHYLNIQLIDHSELDI
jgi:putative DNA primase/helicase